MRLHHFWHWVRVIGAAFVALFASSLSQGQSHSRQHPVLWQLKGKLQQLAFVPGEHSELEYAEFIGFPSRRCAHESAVPRGAEGRHWEEFQFGRRIRFNSSFEVNGQFCSIGQRVGQHRPSD